MVKRGRGDNHAATMVKICGATVFYPWISCTILLAGILMILLGLSIGDKGGAITWLVILGFAVAFSFFVFQTCVGSKGYVDESDTAVMNAQRTQPIQPACSRSAPSFAVYR